MAENAYRLTALQAQSKILSGEITVEQYAQSLLQRIRERHDAVKAWAYIDPALVLQHAKTLDSVPHEERGPLHGVAIAVKDIIYTKGKFGFDWYATQHNSPLYKDDAPELDAASIVTLKQAGALILGKTTTTEFASTLVGPPTRNPHDPNRTPGGSSSGSGAAVGDFQAPIGLGSQTAGSIIRPASFNGVYGFKPTWGAVSREGQKIHSLILDTFGLFTRSTADLELLADVFDIRDDEDSTFTSIQGARFAVCKTMVWEANAGEGTRSALTRATELLRAHGAIVEEIELPEAFNAVPEWHSTIMQADGRTSFLPNYRVDKDKLDKRLVGFVEGRIGVTHRAHLEALDGIAALRPVIDDIAGRYDAILTPSVPDEAPLGLEWTGDPVFCSIWTILHTPVINMPGFQGQNGMPVGLSLVAPRYRDRHLLKVSKAVSKIFETEGGWQRDSLSA